MSDDKIDIRDETEQFLSRSRWNEKTTDEVIDMLNEMYCQKFEELENRIAELERTTKKVGGSHGETN